MAKSLLNYTTFLALLLCFLLISSNEIEVVEGKTCRWQSNLYRSRFCLSSKYCVKRCRDEISKVTKGQCITKGWGRYCFCWRTGACPPKP
uniref:Knottin scorpion toxin-like domain-containing protein n=1 Tax=Solanum lycopersicum TaxID=4081 RepID=K4CCH1_SOLLC